jgi:hypothetical protein
MEDSPRESEDPFHGIEVSLLDSLSLHFLSKIPPGIEDLLLRLVVPLSGMEVPHLRIRVPLPHNLDS